MLKLKSAAAAEPFWIEILPGQRTQFRPITVSMILVAREEAGKAILGAMPKKDAPALEENLADATGRVHFVAALARLGIIAWEGVGDAEGKEIPPTPETVGEYIANWRVHDAVQRLYVSPAIADIDEKNASAPSRPGTSGAKIPAKATANTARKPARNAPTP